MLRGITVVWILVQALERVKRFYKDTLGLPINKEDGELAE